MPILALEAIIQSTFVKYNNVKNIYLMSVILTNKNLFLYWYALTHQNMHYFLSIKVGLAVSRVVRHNQTIVPIQYRSVMCYPIITLSTGSHFLSLEPWSKWSQHKPNEHSCMATVAWFSYYMHYVITSILNTNYNSLCPICLSHAFRHIGSNVNAQS